MLKYTIISYNFNGYDKLREPLINSNNADYIYITDHFLKSTHWRTGIDKNLVNKNPIYSSYYVRYHPFEYTKNDIVVVVDSSIQIKDSLDDIVQDFIDSNSDISVMCTNYPNDESKIKFWIETRKFNNVENINSIENFIKETNQQKYKGSLGTAFSIYKRRATPFLENIWNKLIELGHYGVPNRLDEIVYHKMLNDTALKIYPLSVQIIQSSYMDYYCHNTDKKIQQYLNYDQYYYLNNKPIKPIRYDKNINFPKEYTYNTEAILLTKYLNERDLRDWLDHHLKVCKFEHIVVYDNESDYDVEAICKEYKNVDYEFVEGVPRQYKIYDEHFKKSKAKWIMPIDDDEYLTFSDEFNSVYEAICYYENKFSHMNMLAVRWKHLFPKTFKSDRHCSVLNYCTDENPKLAETFMHLGDRTVKTIVKNYGEIHYEETKENAAGGHVPKNSTYFGAVLFNGDAVLGCGIQNIPTDTSDEKIRLIHCRYKGYHEFKDKMKNIVTVSDETHNKKNWVFNTLLDYLQ